MFDTSNRMQADQFNALQRGVAQRSNAAAGRAGAARADANARFNAGMERQNAIYNSQGQLATDTGNRDFDWGTRQTGIGGLQGIQNSDIGQAQAERDRMMQSYALQYGSQNQAGGQQSQLAVQPGMGTNIIQGIGGIAGAVAPFLGGMGGPKPPPGATAA